LFERQPQSYREEVLPPAVTARVAVEAASPQGWERYAGDKGRIIGLDHFGASAPYKILYEKFGITVERVVEAALETLGRGE
jgi:transketolase